MGTGCILTYEVVLISRTGPVLVTVEVRYADYLYVIIYSSVCQAVRCSIRAPIKLWSRCARNCLRNHVKYILLVILLRKFHLFLGCTFESVYYAPYFVD